MALNISVLSEAVSSPSIKVVHGMRMECQIGLTSMNNRYDISAVHSIKRSPRPEHGVDRADHMFCADGPSSSRGFQARNTLTTTLKTMQKFIQYYSTTILSMNFVYDSL